MKLKRSKAGQSYGRLFSLPGSYPWGPRVFHLLTWDGKLAEKFISVICVCGKSAETWGLGSDRQFREPWQDETERSVANVPISMALCIPVVPDRIQIAGSFGDLS